MKKSKIYTKTGDQGTTALYDGQRLPKENAVFDALGDVDELHACIGFALAQMEVIGSSLSLRHVSEQGLNADLRFLSDIQRGLINVGSALGTPLDGRKGTTDMRVRFTDDCKRLERQINEWDYALPTLTQFILLQGGIAAASLHVARAVCRRAERHVWPLVDEGKVEIEVTQYLNRLADLLYVCARRYTVGDEVPYKKAKA